MGGGGEEVKHIIQTESTTAAAVKVATKVCVFVCV